MTGPDQKTGGIFSKEDIEKMSTAELAARANQVRAAGNQPPRPKAEYPNDIRTGRKEPITGRKKIEPKQPRNILTGEDAARARQLGALGKLPNNKED